MQNFKSVKLGRQPFKGQIDAMNLNIAGVPQTAARETETPDHELKHREKRERVRPMFAASIAFWLAIEPS